jgi:hypothetical protein
MPIHTCRALAATLLVAALLPACGGSGGEGARVQANAQSISFGVPPALTFHGTATVGATASSGLAVTYSSLTSAVCTVNASSGLVTDLTTGTCRIAANQSGNSVWGQAPQATQDLLVIVDPNQTIAFGVAPALTLGGTATVSATATSGLAITYGSTTPVVCTVNAASGLVTDLTIGDCIIAANQAGDAFFNAAPQVTQTINVPIPAGTSAPGVPSGVTATLGSNADTVIVSTTGADSGGSAITGYTVVSSPAGITATAASAPVTVSCGGSCAGRAFSIYATNAIGSGTASAAVDVLTVFDVTTTWHEPDTQPRDSIFIGSFTLNSTTGAITSLLGVLSESMTGDPQTHPTYDYNMTWLQLSNQLQTWHDAGLGGTFAATFKNATTATFYADTWRPEDGVAVGGTYAGYISPFNPGINASNAYALIFVPDDPYAATTQAQINKLAYADCAPGGMMGATCMTGTSIAGYGAVGTMSGYPVSQVITRH